MPYRGLLEVCSVHRRHSQQPPAHWTVCSLADQTFVDVSLALAHAPVLSCRHVTRSAHRASGYQLAAICYSWCGDINKLGFPEPSRQQRLIMYQDNNQTTKTATCATPFLTARRSVSFARGCGHQPSAWTGELPLTIRSGKRGAPSMEVHSITGDSAVISRQWVGELPSFGPSGKGEHRRHIVTTGQNLLVATSTFSLHLQLECSTKSLSTS